MTLDERHILTDIDQTLVGRKIYDANGRPPIAHMQRTQRFVAATLERDPAYFESLARNMHSNTSVPEWRQPQVERPASAYFTYNPELKRLYIEWGLVQGTDAKLHSYLNQVLSPHLRTEAGCIVRSGHYTTTREDPKGGGDSFSVAVLDSLRDPIVNPTQPEYPLVKAMSRVPFIVLTTNGKVCSLNK